MGSRFRRSRIVSDSLLRTKQNKAAGVSNQLDQLGYRDLCLTATAKRRRKCRMHLRPSWVVRVADHCLMLQATPSESSHSTSSLITVRWISALKTETRTHSDHLEASTSKPACTLRATFVARSTLVTPSTGKVV